MFGARACAVHFPHPLVWEVVKMHQCHCQFIPSDVLAQLACDPNLPGDVCRNSDYSAQLSGHLRDVRLQNMKLSGFMLETHAALVPLAPRPHVALFDCKQTLSLPGTPVTQPGSSADDTVKRTYLETLQVTAFLREVFARNSVDGAGMTLVSSVHYGKKFNNAMWNGLQMIYGDGDNELFNDFTLGRDVIGHELAHGLTQYSLNLDYDNEPGGLNESLSDCFGCMFSQWRAGQDAASADWLIGKDIIGKTMLERGFTCLRDMGQPDGKHCLAPQPVHYTELSPGMDPHYTSGPPNLAFFTACRYAGGYSWQSIGKVWYQVMTQSGQTPRMSMQEFATQARKAAVALFGAGSTVDAAVDAGWRKVGL